MSGPIRRDASSDESNFVGATGGDPRVGRVDESNTQPPRRSLVSGPVGATRRTTAERVESTVELCRSDKSTGRYDSKTRVGPRRVAPGRAWTWLMSREPPPPVEKASKKGPSAAKVLNAKDKATLLLAVGL